MKNILITGASGFLGGYILQKLILINEYRIYAITRSKELLARQYENSNIQFFDMDDLNNNKVPFESINTIIHCAFARSNSSIDLSKSLLFADHIFKKAIKNKCHIINISSRSVYGQSRNIPWSESTIVEPDNLYAFAKYSSELILNSLTEYKSGIHSTNLRLAGLLGDELDDRIVNKFIAFALRDNSINIIGGQQQFAYLNVNDAADGIISLLKVPPHKWKTVYNIGYNKSYNILEIANIVAEVAQQFDLPEVKINLEKSNETIYAELDSTLFYKDTNWQPQFDMKAIIKSIFEYQIKKTSLEG